MQGVASGLRALVTGALPRLIHQIRSRVRPPLTLGAQLMVIDQQRRVLLVKPRYAPSWQFPGGGVDRGETAKAAALRETKEETGLAVAGEPVLFGFYFNKAMNQRDHVALFLCERHPTVDEAKLRRPTAEIAAVCVASLDALPADTAVGAQRRIAELAGAPKSEFW